MVKKKTKVSKLRIIMIAILVSVILYAAGLLTGLNANKVVEQKVTQDIGTLKNVLDDSALDLKNIQLQQYYLSSFELENKCKFLDIYVEQKNQQIKNFWNKLPSRLEEYEKTSGTQTNEYISLKREYARFSLRFWLTTKNRYEQCNRRDVIPILYFYTNECSDCIKQGQEYDIFKLNMAKNNQTVIVFPIDADFKDDMIFILKEYYGLEKFPATIINKQIIQGKIIDSEELELALTI